MATVVTVANSHTPIHHPVLQMTPMTGYGGGETSSVSSAAPTPYSLRAQLQPFSDSAPQQIQEQLQRLNIRQQGDPDTSQGAVTTTSILENSLTAALSNGESLSGRNGSTSSITSGDVSSRRSSSGSRSMLEQLLSPTTSANPIQCPQTQGIPTCSSASLYSQSPPYQAEQHLHPLARRRSNPSNPYEASPQQLAAACTNHAAARHYRYSLPFCRNPLIDHMAPQNAYPSFPVNVPQRREGSPTKTAYSGSPTSATNRISPIREVQMDSIAEDTTESTDLAQERPSSPSSYSPAGSPRTVDVKRQRKTGMSLDNTAVQAHIAATFQSNGRRNSYPKQHCYPKQHHLNNAPLQMPLFTPPGSVMSPLHTFTPTTTGAHAELMNHYNTAYQGVLPNAPAAANPYGGIANMLGHVSMVLTNCGIPYQHSNGIFAVDHLGVKLQILVGTLPDLATSSAIQLQYVAGDTQTYRTLCTQLASQLQYAAAQ